MKFITSLIDRIVRGRRFENELLSASRAKMIEAIVLQGIKDYNNEINNGAEDEIKNIKCSEGLCFWAKYIATTSHERAFLLLMGFVARKHERILKPKSFNVVCERYLWSHPALFKVESTGKFVVPKMHVVNEALYPRLMCLNYMLIEIRRVVKYSRLK